METGLDEIWKFKVPREIRPIIEMPLGAKIISCQIQQGEIFLWAIVRPNNIAISRRFLLAFTGQRVNYDLYEIEFIETVQHPNGLVYHLFEETNAHNGNKRGNNELRYTY